MSWPRRPRRPSPNWGVPLLACPSLTPCVSRDCLRCVTLAGPEGHLRSLGLNGHIDPRAQLTMQLRAPLAVLAAEVFGDHGPYPSDNTPSLIDKERLDLAIGIRQLGMSP